MYGNFFSRIAVAMVHLLARNNSAASDTVSIAHQSLAQVPPSVVRVLLPSFDLFSSLARRILSDELVPHFVTEDEVCGAAC